MAAEEGSVREMEEFLEGTGVFGNEPTEPVEPAEEVIHDAPPGQEPTTAPASAPTRTTEPEAKPEGEPEETEEPAEEGEPHLVWARKKYGTDPEKWAKAAYDQERFITQINAEKKQAEEIAQNAIEYAQSVEAQTQARTSMSMPLSAQEEQWVEQALVNPAAYAYQAAREGNVQLYNAVIERVAEENGAGMAAQLGTQVQMALQREMEQYQVEQARHAQANGGQQAPDFNADLGASFQRVGVNVQQFGEAMWTKIEELGEYHPYTLAILGGDAMQRDLAVQAVYDLVRQGETTTRRIGDTEREAQIAREGELRRGAAAVVTGGPHFEPPKQSPLLGAMEEEWRRRGQWTDDE